MKQRTLSNYMKEKHYILKAEQDFLDRVYCLYCQICALYHSNERFLKEKRKGKRFLYFHEYAIIQAS